MQTEKGTAFTRLNLQLPRWRRVVLGVAAPVTLLRAQASDATFVTAAFFLIGVALLIGVPHALRNQRISAVIDAAYLCLESLFAGFLPGFWYALWAPMALVPDMLERSSMRIASGLVSVAASGLLGKYAWGYVSDAGNPAQAGWILVIFSCVVSLLIVVHVRAWREREVRVREELSSRLEARNTMVSTLAHEVKTPLTVLQTSSALLLEEHPGSLNRDQKRLVQQINNGVLRLIHFADNLIASIKVDQRWFSLELDSVDIRRITKRVAEQVESLLAQRSQKLKLNYPALLSRVPGDEQWLEQVMVNLIHNAAKYADPGVVIDVAIRENEQWVVVSIGDNGIGIGGDERFQVFSEFYQGNSPAGAQLNGSGLGLAIVKRVVERHGGEVYVGSVKDIGTIISFTLPKEEASQ